MQAPRFPDGESIQIPGKGPPRAGLAPQQPELQAAGPLGAWRQFQQNLSRKEEEEAAGAVGVRVEERRAVEAAPPPGHPEKGRSRAPASSEPQKACLLPDPCPLLCASPPPHPPHPHSFAASPGGQAGPSGPGVCVCTVRWPLCVRTCLCAHVRVRLGCTCTCLSVWRVSSRACVCASAHMCVCVLRVCVCARVRARARRAGAGRGRRAGI